MHDAVTLANWLNVLPDIPTTAEIEHAFEKYKEERLPWVKQAYDSSLIFKVMIEAVRDFFLFVATLGWDDFFLGELSRAS